MSMIEAIATDIKMSIDDLVHELKKMKTDLRKIKFKLGMIDPEKEEDFD